MLTSYIQAPEVIQADGAYFLYYSVSEFESQDSAIGVARSDTMDNGTWEDLGSTGVESTEGSPYNAIDPSLINVDGTWYMTFGSFWENFFQVPMDGPEKSTGTPAQIAFDPVTTALEGVAIVKNGDFYYLFYSKGSCCKYDAEMPAAGEEYKIMVCRSESATGGLSTRMERRARRAGARSFLSLTVSCMAPGDRVSTMTRHTDR